MVLWRRSFENKTGSTHDCIKGLLKVSERRHVQKFKMQHGWTAIVALYDNRIPMY